ncbi:hypothetical protein EQG49_01285 [Periweissella cryptocerci]|uniref:Uncharacterized protein n=1 Tax=Periweissella cryptocerci TaxID=2506420 RepID=A0A4P6YRG0_9LACO|nr:hypothetical protein [Periweissella cryptocerci]QBO35182.1 hypothetical protein EQG49_01285 [Periweissella cryptocerci]
MKAKVKQISKALAVVTLVASFGTAVAPAVVGSASSKVVKVMPAAYRHTWYAVGTEKGSGYQFGLKAKLKLTKTNYSMKMDTLYEGVTLNSYHEGYKKYSAHKTASGAYKLTMYKKSSGVWKPDATDTLKIVTKKFSGKKYTVLKEGTGSDSLYFFKSVSQAKSSKYNVAKAMGLDE